MNLKMKPYWYLALLIVLLMSLAGCKSGDTTGSLTATPPPAEAGELLPEGTPPPAVTPTPEYTHDPNPLRLVFPTPGADPSFLWRPPLGEAPWALGAKDHFYFSRPIAVDEVNWPLADYRYGYVFPDSTILHTGIDIDAPPGTPVIAAASGRVVWAGYGLLHGDEDPEDPYGLAVMIRHDFGFEGHKLQTVYAHMDEINVILGQRVETGDTLGLVGNTGNTTGPHLHFEVRLESGERYYTHRNPELWLTPPQGMGVLVGRLLDGTGSFLSGVEVTVKSQTTGRKWIILSYAPWLNSDEYYRENLVLSDLPVGDYTLSFTQRGTDYTYDFSIHNGAVTYFVFRDGRGFSNALPSQDAPEGWIPIP